MVYKLPETHDADAVNAAPKSRKRCSSIRCAILTIQSQRPHLPNKTVITEWIKSMREEEGVKCQAVLANHEADSEGIINVVQGVILTADGTRLTAQKLLHG